jgi:gag-polyprotein putative aspartyl protease
MTFPFDPQQGLVVIRAELTGPSGSAVLQLALDTGATSTLVNAAPLTALGYDPALSPERVQITTGSSVEFVPRVVVARFVALGEEKSDFSVLCHTLPPSAAVDGLLGLDFLRGRNLELDFRNGRVTLS